MLECHYQFGLMFYSLVEDHLLDQNKMSSLKLAFPSLRGKGLTHLSQTTGLASFMTGPREEQACRGGGAMGTAESRELALRWKAS